MSNASQQSTDLTAKLLKTMSGHEGYIGGIADLPGVKGVVSWSSDKTIRIWDVEKGKQEGTSMVHESWIYCLAVTRDGKRILSGGEKGRIRVWDVEAHESVQEWASYSSFSICSIALSPDDRCAASGDSDGKIIIREMKEGGKIKHSMGPGSCVSSLCFSPDGKKLACAVYIGKGVGHVIQVYDTDSGKLVLGPIKGHESWIRCVLWSLDGFSRLFSASDDGTIQCWNSETGKSIGGPWTRHTRAVYSLSLSPDGTKLASASCDNTVRFWDACSGGPIGHPLQHESHLFAVTFTSSGEFVPSGGNDQNVSIWRVPWWDERQKLAHPSLLEFQAVPVAKDQQIDSLDLSTGSRPFTSSSRPPVLPATTTSISTRVSRLPEIAWNFNDE
ncbi:WD40 repeat-like protein [Paxillus ammoniavirescens]|nr:WD40 repeat-like protein [Paxillus ammoniavirescens]